MDHPTAAADTEEGIQAPEAPDPADVVAVEVLVEEVSIDGMCGVY